MADRADVSGRCVIFKPGSCGFSVLIEVFPGDGSVLKEPFPFALLFAVFVFAFLIRLLGALPGLSNPQLLMRPDSAAFLADAGKGILEIKYNDFFPLVETY